VSIGVNPTGAHHATLFQTAQLPDLASASQRAAKNRVRKRSGRLARNLWACDGGARTCRVDASQDQRHDQYGRYRHEPVRFTIAGYDFGA
jgi:hypothetical protein